MAKTSRGKTIRPTRRGKQHDPDVGTPADKVIGKDEAVAKTAPDARPGKNCPTGKSAAEFLPANPLDVDALRKAASACQGCPLYCNATQTVFGEGPTDAAVMFVGEQPGDREDRAGKPFVGPSGQLLDEAMEQAGIPRERVYVTNAVKHFKFEPRGPRRIHSKPGAREVNACRPWLEAEIAAVKPKMIVCLGATAAQSLMGKQFRVTQQRGEVLENPWAPALLATVHPSSLLRIPDDEQRERAFAEFVDDLRKVARHIRP
jgi:DNA polymerase